MKLRFKAVGEANKTFTATDRRALLTIVSILFVVTAPAQTNGPPAKSPAPIPMDQLGAVAGQQYHGDALGITAKADGALLRCGFQKLQGHATTEGLWLESTESGGGRFRLVATSLERADMAGSSRCDDRTAQRAVPTTMLPVSGIDFAKDFLDISIFTPQLCSLQTTGSVEVAGDCVRFARPGLTEEYFVSVDGLRQDFVIAERPAGGGELCVSLELTGARAETTPGGARIVFNDSKRALVYTRLRATDATGRELTARLEVLGSATAPVAPFSPSLTGSDNDSGRAGSPLPAATGWPDSIGAQRTARPTLLVLVDDANATYPIRIDPTFSDADWVSLNPGMPGANDWVAAIVSDADGNVYVGGDFTYIATVAANGIAKWNGSTWSALGSGVSGSLASVRSLAVSGTNLYAGGCFYKAGGVTANHVAKWDGSAWSALGTGLDERVFALAASGNNLYACGGFSRAGGMAANRVAKWDGAAWSALGSGPGGDTYVGAFATIGNDLYAGGTFDSISGVSANKIAKWNGSTWSALGLGMNGYVAALAVNGNNLYAGGNFTTAGGKPANLIAEWDGSTWSALGSGVSGHDAFVAALAVSETNLFVGGTFTNAGGVAANGIAKWNGSTWSAVGSGIMINQVGGTIYNVQALAVNGTNLYVGGYFTNAGGALADNIAKWDGNAWSALAPLGINGSVHALAVDGTDLCVGGDFTSVSGVAANHVAKWNGSTWSALGSGIGGYGWVPGAPWVLALAVSGTNLYVGGNFTTAGGISANRIAKWNGNVWSALGSGLDNSPNDARVNALAVSGSDLYVGGGFSTAGGVTANNIAKWDGNDWSALGSGVDGGVSALAVIGNDLYAGGGFNMAGGVSAYYIAKWNGRPAWELGPLGHPDPERTA